MKNQLIKLAGWLTKLNRRLNQSFESGRHFDWGDKKIFVVSLHKSGTHLIENILGHAGLERQSAGRKDYSTSDLARLKPNQYLLSHFSPSSVNVYDLIETKRVRAVLNYRDPRDVCVSRFNWWRYSSKVTNTSREFLKKAYSHLSDEEFIEYIIRGERLIEPEIVLGDMYRLARGLLFHPYAHKTRFEDLVGPRGGGSLEKQIESIGGLLEFLEIDVDPEVIAEKSFDKRSETFHKGQIGSYKEVFTEEHVLLFDQLHGDILRDFGYSSENVSSR